MRGINLICKTAGAGPWANVREANTDRITRTFVGLSMGINLFRETDLRWEKDWEMEGGTGKKEVKSIRIYFFHCFRRHHVTYMGKNSTQESNIWNLVRHHIEQTLSIANSAQTAATKPQRLTVDLANLLKSHLHTFPSLPPCYKCLDLSQS